MKSLHDQSSDKTSGFLCRLGTALSVLLCLLLIGGCSGRSTIVLPPELPDPVPPVVAMQPCPSSLPTITQDLESLWATDPSAVPVLILTNEAAQGAQYRDCARSHQSLIDWVNSLE